MRAPMISATIAVALLLSGCVAGTAPDKLAEVATPLPPTKTGLSLERLGPPKRQVAVGVYELKDETGQNKPNDTFAEYSRAVTQAGDSILIDVLKKTARGAWFRVYERNNLKDVLQERQIFEVSQQELFRNRGRLGTVGFRDQNDAFADPLGAQERVLAAQRKISEAQNAIADAQQRLAAQASGFTAQGQQSGQQPGPSGFDTDLARSQVELIRAQNAMAVARAEQEQIKALQDYSMQRTQLDMSRLQQKVNQAKAQEDLSKQFAPRFRPLGSANLILTGSIAGYDSNETTGGVGARFLGIGADKQYRRDLVTVALRLVDVRTGEVLISVASVKTIYSVALRAGLYRFVDVDKIFEAEGGVSRNEPPSIAVRHGIESAVLSLIVEGAKRGLWHFGDDAERDYVIGTYEQASLVE
jgi:curli biogenesis system outer membrane secretion channel CsgG